MEDRSSYGTPHQPVAPSGSQITEPSPWHLLYDLNATVSRVDEAVSGLKERTSDVNRRVEESGKKLDTLSDEVNQARGSLKTLVWVVGIVGPLVALLLEALLKHVKLL